MIVSERDRLWGYAATFGAMWGGVEITVGSFLHTVKIPFSGVVLASVGAGLLLTLRSVYPRTGVILAAGLVCAGIKLLSPAGAVLGPVVAILMESLLVELSCLLWGPRFGAALMSGTLVGFWTVTQKLLTQTIFYGAPVLSIYRGVLKRAEQWLGLPAAGGFWVAALFLSLVAAIGTAAAWSGLRVGLAARTRIERPVL